MMQDILNFKIDELTNLMTCFDEKSFRAKQVFAWLSKGIDNFDEMDNLPLSLREKLKEAFYIGLPEVLSEQISKVDATRKCLFGFKDGDEIAGTKVEAVLMKYEYGNTICLSSQAGCRMACSFCASGKRGLYRNLTAGEMYAELLQMRNLINEDIRHIVVMGTGEPFDNYDELSRFIRIVNDPNGYNLGMRNITVSTCGIVPMIERFSEDFPQVNLAISLHAHNDALRRAIMPVAKKYPMDELLRACASYTEKTGRRISFEYALIKDKNDSIEDAERLADALLSHLKPNLMHVNLIPLNKIDDADLQGSDKKNAEHFRATLEKKKIAATIRRTLGPDIDAACGQLRNRA